MEHIEIYKGFNARMCVSVKTRRGGKHKPAVMFEKVKVVIILLKPIFLSTSNG